MLNGWLIKQQLVNSDVLCCSKVKWVLAVTPTLTFNVLEVRQTFEQETAGKSKHAQLAFFRINIRFRKYIIKENCRHSRAGGSGGITKIYGLMHFFCQDQQSCHFVREQKKTEIP